MILRAIELAKEAGLQVCLDMASYNIVAGDHEFFSLLVNKYVDIVFANEEEAKAFTGKEPEEALDIIAKMCSIAIVKVGSRGSLIRKGTEEVYVEAVPVERVVDTTGAGDSFCAGVVSGFSVWADLRIFFGEVRKDRRCLVGRGNTGGWNGVAGFKMGKDKGRYYNDKLEDI